MLSLVLLFVVTHRQKSRYLKKISSMLSNHKDFQSCDWYWQYSNILSLGWILLPLCTLVSSCYPVIGSLATKFHSNQLGWGPGAACGQSSTSPWKRCHIFLQIRARHRHCCTIDDQMREVWAVWLHRPRRTYENLYNYYFFIFYFQMNLYNDFQHKILLIVITRSY